MKFTQEIDLKARMTQLTCTSFKMTKLINTWAPLGWDIKMLGTWTNTSLHISTSELGYGLLEGSVHLSILVQFPKGIQQNSPFPSSLADLKMLYHSHTQSSVSSVFFYTVFSAGAYYRSHISQDKQLPIFTENTSKHFEPHGGFQRRWKHI